MNLKVEKPLFAFSHPKKVFARQIPSLKNQHPNFYRFIRGHDLWSNRPTVIREAYGTRTNAKKNL